jgi:hypothetical protein
MDFFVENPGQMSAKNVGDKEDEYRGFATLFLWLTFPWERGFGASRWP